jgi:hypothetical protein
MRVGVQETRYRAVVERLVCLRIELYDASDRSVPVVLLEELKDAVVHRTEGFD